MLDFSDRTITGISRLISCCAHFILYIRVEEGELYAIDAIDCSHEKDMKIKVITFLAKSTLFYYFCFTGIDS